VGPPALDAECMVRLAACSDSDNQGFFIAILETRLEMILFESRCFLPVSQLVLFFYY
jgi:hypothetical protein